MNKIEDNDEEQTDVSESSTKPKQVVQLSISKHIQKCLEMTSIYESDFSEIVDTSELLQALSQSDLSLIGNVKPIEFDNFVADIKSIEKTIKESSLQDVKAENYLKLLEKYSKSIEAQITVLTRMIAFHHDNKNKL